MRPFSWRPGERQLESQRFRVRANAVVEAKDLRIQEDRPGHLQGGEMDGVEGAHGFEGKRTPRAIEDLPLDSKQGPETGLPVQDRALARRIGGRKLTGVLRPNQRALTFHEQKRRRNDIVRTLQQTLNDFSPRLPEKSRRDRAGFHIEIHRSPLS